MDGLVRRVPNEVKHEVDDFLASGNSPAALFLVPVHLVESSFEQAQVSIAKRRSHIGAPSSVEVIKLHRNGACRRGAGQVSILVAAPHAARLRKAVSFSRETPLLAQILPGFRDFRTPLVTGYLWIVVLWILVEMPLPDKDAKDGVMGAINSIGEFFTPTVYIAVLSFLAYVIGMLLMVDIKPGSTVRLGSRLRLPYVSMTDRAIVEGHVEAALHRARLRAADGFKIQREFRLEPMLKTEQAYDDFRLDHHEDKRAMNESWRQYALRQLKEPMVEENIKSIPSLAIKLQDKNALLFGSYDRDKSESEFRLSIAPPLAVLSVQFIMLGADRTLVLWPWAGYVGLIAVVALVVKGFQKRFSSVNVVVTALEIGTIESQMTTRLDAVPADVYDDKTTQTT
ncbi:hypothetical protein [Arthrobacter globiformis]|uniref:hypothetical protein n=1 Tax=Arthrobacter globiformis TaxID=1665 RepID=UPI002794B7EC|nr:hypothetical protein [Arthrobacter globiformis]MDQ0618065.1 hypothetical protein [Arthrobacter globiformis]